MHTCGAIRLYICMCRAYRVCSPRQLAPKSTSCALPRLHGSGALELGTVLPSSPRPTYKHDFIHTQLYIFRSMLGLRRHHQHSNGILHVPHSWNGLDGVRQCFMNTTCTKLALARAVSSESMATELLFHGRLARMDST